MAVISRLAASACAAGLAVGLAVAAHAGGVDGPHVLPAPDHWTNMPPNSTKGLVSYYGGPVVSQIEIVSILWGPNVNPTTIADVPEFLTAMANSTYVDQLAIYDTFRRGVNGHRGSRQHIERGTFYGQVEIVPKNQSQHLSDRQIRSEIEYQIGKGALPPQTLNMWYMIYFPQNISIYLPGYGYSCSDWGAYHWATDRVGANKSNIYYGVEPDCGGGIDTITWTSSHEFAETLTDPVAPPGTPHYADAWVTQGDAEIGDLCMGSYGTLSDGRNSYVVQQIYLDRIPGCSTGNYTSP